MLQSVVVVAVAVVCVAVAVVVGGTHHAVIRQMMDCVHF